MNVTQLPNEMQTYTFSFLDEKSLVSASGVCKKWNLLINKSPDINKFLWKALFEKRYNYIPQTPSLTFRELYIRRTCLLKALNTSSHQERSLTVNNLKNSFITTHFIISHTGSTISIFDRITHHKLDNVLPLKHSQEICAIAPVTKDVFQITTSSRSGFELFVYDVSDKASSKPLFSTKVQDLIHSNVQNRIVYRDSEKRLCLFDTLKKEAIYFKDIIINGELRVLAKRSNMLALLINSELTVIDLTLGKITHSFKHTDIDLSFLESIHDPHFLCTFTGNNMLLIGRMSAETKKILVIDLNTQKARALELPGELRSFQIKMNERFLVMNTAPNIHLYIWNLDIFADTPEQIKEEESNCFTIQHIDGERLIALSDTAVVKIWDLNTKNIALRHLLDPTQRYSMPISQFMGCVDRIAWIQINDYIPTYTMVHCEIMAHVFIDLSNVTLTRGINVKSWFPELHRIQNPTFDEHSLHSTYGDTIHTTDLISSTIQKPQTGQEEVRTTTLSSTIQNVFNSIRGFLPF